MRNETNKKIKRNMIIHLFNYEKKRETKPLLIFELFFFYFITLIIFVSEIG